MVSVWEHGKPLRKQTARDHRSPRLFPDTPGPSAASRQEERKQDRDTLYVLLIVVAAAIPFACLAWSRLVDPIMIRVMQTKPARAIAHCQYA